MVQVPPFDTVRPGQELLASPSIEDNCPMKYGTLAATPGGHANERDIPVSSSRWKDIAVLLNWSATITLLAWFTPPMALRSFYFGVLFQCRSTLLRRVWKCSLLKRLEVAECMQTFLTQQIDNNEELRTQLMQVKSELTTMWKAATTAEKLLKELEEGV
ncbi:hypothetical protein PVL29_009461 [Vitis rotundifolia]|uniref:Uncharacterized protein n=1 Tax=Vitis rotundifolia TaxID=103349 RepID=A0AA38ZR98_VITRO|nr:hypothetical protein PVL29_009461 [Vitis rotundifolia]